MNELDCETAYPGIADWIQGTFAENAKVAHSVGSLGLSILPR